jgi:hypothetical protein
MADKAADDAKGGTALDKLLKGLDAMAAKLDSMGSRLDAMETRKDADPPPPPPPAAKELPAGEGEPVPAAADIKKDAAPPEAPPPAPPPPAPPPLPVAPAKDALPPEFLKNKAEPGDGPPDEKKDAADSVGDLNALRKRLAKLEASMPKDRTDHDLAADQAAADSVYSLFGESAPRPLIGDSRTSYVLRNLERFKTHSADWKNVDLAPVSVDERVLNIAADQIYAAARAAAANPANVPQGTLRAITTRTPTGHLETRFMGSPSAWMNRHAPNRRFVTAIDQKKGN